MATALGNLAVLPAEIRCHIWKYVLIRDTPICASPGVGPKPHAAILTTCRLIHRETLPIFYESNTFTVLIHQSKQRPWGNKIAHSESKMIKSARVEVMIDHQGPTTAFLQNIARSIYWIRSIGSSLERVYIAIYEGDEHESARNWMPGLRNEVIAKFLNVTVPHVVMVVPTRLLSKLRLDSTAPPYTGEQALEAFEALVKMMRGGDGKMVDIRNRTVIIMGSGEDPGWGELFLRSGGP